VNRGSSPAGNPRRVVRLLVDNVLDAPGRIVKRNRLQPSVFGKQIAALVERNRMRENAPHVSKFRTRWSYQVVHDAQAKLADNINLASKQQIEVLRNRSSQRVLDRNYCAINASSRNPI